MEPDPEIKRLQETVEALRLELSQAQSPPPGLFKRLVEKIAGYKTVVFGSLLGIVGPVLDYLGALDLTQAGIAPAMAFGIGAVVVALRVMTKGPIFRGEG